MSTEVDLIGHQARSREGRGLSVRSGDSDKWILIQKNTFMNWVNLQLQGSGHVVQDFERDFDNGVKLCALVEALQHKKIGKVIKNPINQHQSLENVTIALRAIADDNVRLVNIGSEDIVNGSLKLILGLVWHLILRYQIGKTKFPPKKLMLAWLQAVIPECHINNFTSDWNDGVALSALIDYCQPGLFPHWRQLSRHNNLENCRNAMNIAEQNLKIPKVVHPEDFASPHLDDLSGMTYLSYYMMPESPGYYATRREIRKILQTGTFENFTTDWNDGRLLCTLVKSVGGTIPGWPNLSNNAVENLQKGLSEGERLGVQPIFNAQEMADPDVEHLGIMAYAAHYTSMKPVKINRNAATFQGDMDKVYIGKEKTFQIHLEDGSPNDMRAVLTGNDSSPPVHVQWQGQTAHCSFTPVETGQHKLDVQCEGKSISGCPVNFRVIADRSRVTFHPPARCCVGTSSELKVDASSAGNGDVRIEARSPSGHVQTINPHYRSGTYEGNFTPTEAGTYNISVLYDGEHISGSPYQVQVFDPSQVNVYGLEGGAVGRSLTFTADATRAGFGDIDCMVSYQGSEIPAHVVKDGNGEYKIDFTPKGPGQYKVNVYMNDMEVKGSPYYLDIVDSSLVTLSGEGLSLVPVDRPTAFTIHTKGAGNSSISVDISDPDGDNVHYDKHTEHDGDLKVTYTPTKVGDHVISVKCSGQDVTGSPFVAKAYSTKAIKVTPLKDGIVGHPMSFTIDVQAAGEGQLQIMVNGGNIPNEVEALDSGVYQISFIPVQPGQQQVDIRFNDEALPISPLACDARPLEAEIIGFSDLVPINIEHNFRLKSSASAGIDSEVIVMCPSGQPLPCRITGQGSSAQTVEYTPTEVGTYTISASIAGRPVKGSPFRVKTFDPSKVKVSNIMKGVVGVPNKFIVDASTAGEGTMEIAVGADGRNIPNQAHPLGNGKYEVSFVGRQPVKHEAVITYNGHQVPGSPFLIDFIDASQMSATGEGLSLVPAHRHAEFSVHAPTSNLRDLTVEVTGPDGRSVPAHLRDVGNGTYKVDWVPSNVGSHRVLVEYAGVPIGRSPYTVQVYDASLVTVSKLGQGFVGKPVTFSLDASNAGDGNLEIHVASDGESIPNYVRQERDAYFKVTFTPQRPKRHSVNVTFNGEPVPGSPFTCDVLDTDSITVTGDGLRPSPANITTSFKVDPKAAGDFDLRAWIVAPSGHDVPVRITGNPRSAYRVDYTPVDVGTHKVHVEYGGREVKGSPFDVEVFDPALVRVNSIGRAYLSKPFVIYCDTALAGQGKLEAEVKSRSSVVPCQIREIGGGRCELSFVPREINTHRVDVSFSGVPLPGSPYHVDVIDSSTVSVSGEGLHSAKVYRETWFNLDLHGMDASELDVSVTGPSGARVPCGISRKGHISRVEFTPMEPGPHSIDVLFAGLRVQGSPFTCQAYDPSRVRITDVDRTGKKEREIGFTIDTSAAGRGELEVGITHQGYKIHSQRESLGDGKYRYTFTPPETGHYEVKATFNQETIPGCPLIINVEDDTPTFITISFRSIEPMNMRGDRKNYFMLHTEGNKIDSDMLDVNIEAPTGEQLSSQLIENAEGDYKVEWMPKQPGRHSVDVMFGGQRVKGSPFYIEVFDVTKIRVDNFFHGNVGQPAGFSVDTSRAGKCEQSVRIVSPSGRSIPVETCEATSHGYNITYIPSESGQHRIYLTYNSLELPGSPFTQEIAEGKLPTAHGDGLSRGEEDKPAIFFIDSRGMTGEPFVQVDGPNSIAKVSIDPKPDGQYAVTYIPVEVGLFDIQVKWNGKEINGSPFHPKVVCSRKVQVVGGWQHYMDNKERVHLVVNEQKEIPFDTSEAGPGHMTAEVKGPSGYIPANVDESSVGRSKVLFTPREEGNHHIYVYWSDTPLVNSPFLGYATSGHLDPSKVILTGRGLKEAIVREEAEFMIDASQAGKGEPEVQLMGVKAEVNVFVTPLGGGKFRCTYIPVVPGAYLLHITWNGRQLRGSPYKVNVIGAFYPNKVAVTGEGLKGGLLGRDLDIRIDTRKAGPGELTAYCMGPNKVANCELEDHHDGTFRLIVRPQEPGRHVLQVKYGGEHVLGSPFAFKVSAQPDASKVRVSGPGVEHGILATFQSRFVVETRGAGAGQLTVRIRGPKGAFQVEMYRDSQRDRTILCRYDPTETGLYIISIRWSGVDVPGSPFHVHILDTQAELEQVLADQSFHNASFHSSRASGYGQWREEF